MIKNLDIDLLRTFVAVVEKQSMLAASGVVGRSQAAVTQQMQRLSEQVGRKLFIRSVRGYGLTEEGQKLLGYGRRMLLLNDEVLHAFSGVSPNGEIRLGAPHDVTETILPDLLTLLAQMYPELRIAIHVGRSPFLIRDLRNGDLDLTIAATDETDLRGITLRTSPIVWLSASTFTHRPNEPIPLIVADELSFFRRISTEYLDRAGIAWRIGYTSPTLVGVRAAVRAGLGVTARSIEMLGPDLRVLGNAENLPRLPDVAFRLYISPRNMNPIALQIFDQVERKLS